MAIFKTNRKRMSQEIERKFLVASDEYKSLSFSHQRIEQGYLSSNPDRTVRVRIYGSNGFLTIKGRTTSTGMSRYEWEKAIAQHEAEELLALCEEGVISKVRYKVAFKGHTFEVDEFYGDNEGLIVAEVELNAENEKVELPAWIGMEVTGDARFFNSALSKHPFKKW